MESLSVGSSISGQNASIQETVGPDAEITPTSPLTTEVVTLIDRMSSLHQHEYVIEEVTDYRIDPTHYRIETHRALDTVLVPHRASCRVSRV